MKTLAFTIAILIVLTTVSYALFSRFTDNTHLQTAYVNQLANLRKKENDFQKMLWKTLSKKKQAKKQPQEPRMGAEEQDEEEDDEQHKHASRSLQPLPETARINIAGILTQKDKSEWYPICARLLRILYGNEQFFKDNPGMEYLILDSLHEKYMAQKDNPQSLLKISQAEHLSNLSLDDPKLHEAFYKMLKGTNDPKTGYPSLLDYITLDFTKKNSAINFHYAPENTLKAAFNNPELVQDILRKQHSLTTDPKNIAAERWHTLEKHEVDALLNAHQMSPSAYEKIFRYDFIIKLKKSAQERP